MNVGSSYGGGQWAAGDEPIYYIVSPKDVVIAKPRLLSILCNFVPFKRLVLPFKDKRRIMVAVLIYALMVIIFFMKCTSQFGSVTTPKGILSL